jgi:hypothetical protein
MARAITALFKKLALKPNFEGPLHVLEAPHEFAPHIAALADFTTLAKLPISAKDPPATFVLAFLLSKAEVDAVSPKLAKSLVSDAVLWACYPKKTSKA